MKFPFQGVPKKLFCELLGKQRLNNAAPIVRNEDISVIEYFD
jgi:hypothetical protein